VTLEELQAGVDANNARALDPGAWRLRWIFLDLVPTGTYVQAQFQIPAAAALYKLEYLLAWWPVGPGAFRPLFMEVMDDRGQKYVFVDKGAELGRGANVALFTTPNTDPDSALAGDQAAYKGMMPLNIEFPGRCTLTLAIRGATATPDPTSIKILLAGHQKNQV
jgi:hypothetical protein